MTESDLIREGIELVDRAHAGALIAAAGDGAPSPVAICVDDEEPRTVENEDAAEVSDET